MWMRRVVFFVFFLRTSSARGGAGCCQTFSSDFFFLFSRPRAGLATVYSSFFGLATNALNVRNNSAFWFFFKQQQHSLENNIGEKPTVTLHTCLYINRHAGRHQNKWIWIYLISWDHVCTVRTFSRVWINRVWLPVLLVVCWTGKRYFSLSPSAPENLVPRDRFGRSVPRQPAHFPHSGWIWCLLTGFLPISAAASIYLFKPPYIVLVPSLSGHVIIAYRWRSLPRVRRHR